MQTTPTIPARFVRHDPMTMRTMPIFGFRIAIGVVIASLCAASLDVRTGIVWGFAAASAELVLWFASARSRARERMSKPERAVYLTALVWINVVWSAMAVILWEQSRAAPMAAAICMLATQLLHAQIFAGHSRSVLLAVGGVPMATLLVLVALFDGGLSDRLLVGGACLIMIAYMSRAALLNASQLREIETAKQGALQSSEAKSAFIGFISHELRTPLTGILGLGQALKSEPDGPGRDLQLKSMMSSGQMMLDLLNDLLDISKMEAGRLELEIDHIDIRDKLETTEVLWRTVAQAKDVRLACAFSNVDGLHLKGDGLRIRQIINNLVSNALKFTERGEVRVEAIVTRQSDGGAELALSVTDTGIGMTEEQVTKVFTAYQQADVSIARRFGGTGLGLSICRDLIGRMGGSIDVQSVYGEGSCFTARIPLAVTDVSSARRTTVESGDLTGLAILLVDDNATNRLVGKTLLEAIGANVRLASSGEEAVETARRTTFDVVLMDIHMPGAGGVNAMRCLRVEHTALCVIALTADGGEERRAALMRDGFDGVETKPINLASLFRTIGGQLQEAPVAPGPVRSAA